MRGGEPSVPQSAGRASAPTESVPIGQRAVSTPAYLVAPGVNAALSKSVPSGSRAVSIPGSRPRRALDLHHPSYVATGWRLTIRADGLFLSDSLRTDSPLAPRQPGWLGPDPWLPIQVARKHLQAFLRDNQ